MNQLRAAALLLFAAYFVVQLAGKTYAQKGEYFPVFSWSLFSIVRNDVLDVVVEVARIGDQVYEPARNYYDMPETFVAARNRDISVVKSARKLVRAVLRSDGIADREEHFAASFLNVGTPVDYQLVLVRFDPLDRWRTGQVTDHHVISTHSTRSLP